MSESVSESVSQSVSEIIEYRAAASQLKSMPMPELHTAPALSRFAAFLPTKHQNHNQHNRNKSGICSDIGAHFRLSDLPTTLTGVKQSQLLVPRLQSGLGTG